MRKEGCHFSGFRISVTGNKISIYSIFLFVSYVTCHLLLIFPFDRICHAMATERVVSQEESKSDWRSKALIIGGAMAVVGATFSAWRLAAVGVVVFGSAAVWPKKKEG